MSLEINKNLSSVISLTNNFSNTNVNSIEKENEPKNQVKLNSSGDNELEDFIKVANIRLEKQHTELRFVKHEKLNEYHIQLVDFDNNVIQEIPSKKELDFFAEFMEFNQLINKKI
jgi:uncharacterized FlaG/YvyC family protein